MSESIGTFRTSKREVRTAISSDVEMPIRRTDWKRVFRKVSTIPRETSIYEVVESVAWGVSGSSLLTLIPLYQATQATEAWVKPTFWAVAVATALIAVISHHFSSERREIIRSTCEEVLQDMRDVYETFFSDGSLG